MVQAISYDSKIDRESSINLLNTLNELLAQDDETMNDLTVVLYYSSPGGEVYWANYQTDFLNRCLDYFNIEIYTGSVIMSAAVDVLKNFKGNIIVDNLTVGMIHHISSDLNTKELNTPHSYDSFILKQHMVENKKSLAMYKDYITEEEATLFKNGKEVYLNASRLKDILYDSKKTTKTHVITNRKIIKKPKKV